MTPTNDDARQKVVLRQMIEARAEDVFDAWLDPASVAVWMCPGDIAHTEATIDAREGGAFRFVMHERGGNLFVQEGKYLELKRPSRLVFTWASAETDHVASTVTVELHARGAETELVLTHEELPHAMSREMHAAGWTMILAKLRTAVASNPGNRENR